MKIIVSDSRNLHTSSNEIAALSLINELTSHAHIAPLEFCPISLNRLSSLNLEVGIAMDMKKSPNQTNSIIDLKESKKILVYK